VQPAGSVAYGGQVRQVLQHEDPDAQQLAVRRPRRVVEVVDVDRVDPDKRRPVGGQPLGAGSGEVGGPLGVGRVVLAGPEHRVRRAGQPRVGE